IEMQATLKNFTTLEGYTIIENPKLSHLFYEHIRTWQPKNVEEEDLKQASDENNYASDSKKAILVYISFTKFYNKQNEKDIILQALQGRHINKENLTEYLMFIVKIIMKMNNIYDHFNLNQWNAKVIVTCRSSASKEEDIKTCLIDNNNQNHINDCICGHLQKYRYVIILTTTITIGHHNNMKMHWTIIQIYKKWWKNLFFFSSFWMFCHYCKKIMKNTRISRSQVYQVFNDQWINNHAQNIILKLKELKFERKRKTQVKKFDQIEQHDQLESNYMNMNNLNLKNLNMKINKKNSTKILEIFCKHVTFTLKYHLTALLD
ncbi:hypothetical protein RFI_31577, partial [Reticulomyxa filosa]